MSQSDDDNIELQGPKKTIAHAVAANGRRYAKEFLNEQVPDRDLAPLAKTFEYLCKLDQFHNDQRFKKLKGEKKLFEFRSNDVRIGAFMVGDVLFLTHGFFKKRDNWPERQLRRARRIMAEHLQTDERSK